MYLFVLYGEVCVGVEERGGWLTIEKEAALFQECYSSQSVIEEARGVLSRQAQKK